MKYAFIARPFLLLGLVLFTSQLFSQEITDTRRSRESFSRFKVPGLRADLASFTFSGISESALAPKLKRISPSVITKDSLVIEGEGIFAKVLLKPFDPTAHKIIYDFDDKTPIRIDKKPYYGDYGTMPQFSIASITMTIDGENVEIPPMAYSDLMNMNFTYVNKGTKLTVDGVFISKDGQNIYLYLFSDNRRGNYEVTFIISDKQYVRRVLDYDFL